MSGKIKTEIISRRCIKPKSPTPAHLKSFKLSLLDQLSPNFHSNITFFFPHHANVSDFFTKSQLLQTSLSYLLSQIYPLAGRLCDPATVECNDEGMFYVEARTVTPLSHFLMNPNSDDLELFLPSSDKQTVLLSNGSFFLVQFTLFGCGGTALGVTLTHKITDLATFLTVLRSWTATCQKPQEAKVPHVTNLGLAATLLPPREIPAMSASVNAGAGASKFTSRRLVFGASMLGKLKQQYHFQFQPSRVELVLALIWRFAMLSHFSKTGSFKPSMLFQGVNLRPRMDPPVAETTIGNMVWPFMVMVEEENDMEVYELVRKMREGMNEFVEKKARRFREGGGFEAVMEFIKERGEMLRKKEETLIYRCTSWCRARLYEELDYGWGKPVWMWSVNKMVSNTIALLDGKDGGIEALVSLDEKEMEIFEMNQELLQFAQINPSVVLPCSESANRPNPFIRAAM